MILPSDTEEMRKVIERQWSLSLSLSEYRILMMVFDRTMGWGKVWEKITYRQFIDGVHGSDGTVWHCGTGLTPATVSKGLGRLTDMRLIFRDDRGRYTINQTWTPMMKEPKRVRSTEAALARPRKLRGEAVQSISTPSVAPGEALQNLKCSTSKSIVPPLQNLKPKIEKKTWRHSKIQTREQSSRVEPPGGDTTEGALRAAEAAILTRRLRTVSRMKEGAAKKQADLEAVWVAAQSECDPHYLHIAWTNTQKARLASIFRRFPAAERAATFVEFITAVVKQWSYFAAQLPWARFPTEPSIGTLLSQYQAILDVWRGDRAWQAATGSTTARSPQPAKAQRSRTAAAIVSAPEARPDESTICIMPAAPRSPEEEL